MNTSRTGDEGWMHGREVPFRDHELVVGSRGRVYYYLGYVRNPRDPEYDFGPCDLALEDADGLSSKRFVRLSRGTLHFSRWLDNEGVYRVPADTGVSGPSRRDPSFGVMRRSGRRDWSLDEEVTRKLFGGTWLELSQLVSALAVLRGHELPGLGYPKITCSPTRDNTCNLSGCYIPKEFPYVASAPSSHISLHALYRFIGWLCGGREQGTVSSNLQRAGLSEGLIEQFVQCSLQHVAPLRLPA